MDPPLLDLVRLRLAVETNHTVLAWAGLKTVRLIGSDQTRANVLPIVRDRGHIGNVVLITVKQVPDLGSIRLPDLAAESRRNAHDRGVVGRGPPVLDNGKLTSVLEQRVDVPDDQGIQIKEQDPFLPRAKKLGLGPPARASAPSDDL